MQTFITDLLFNPYTLGGVVALVLQRWVAPPVYTAVMADAKDIWAKIFPPKA